jgi:phosphoesterase RecJ-like protein
MIEHLLNKVSRVLVITHVDPDGDAIGSLTAVGQALRQRGQQFTLVCDDLPPERFSFLPMFEAIQQQPDPRMDYELLIAVDCGDELRMGGAYEDLALPRPPIINIDHHKTNTEFGDFNLVKPEATSTTEILVELFDLIDVVLDPGIATSLLTGLVTDTLGFRTVGVTPNTLRTAARLMEAGADLGDVSMRALNLRAFKTLKLWGIGLPKMRLEEGVLWISLTNAERESVNFRANSSVGLVNLMGDVQEASMSAVLMEVADGSVRVGLRCRPPFDVAEVAFELGGGGHRLASGCSLPGPLDVAEELVVRHCKAAVARQQVRAELSPVEATTA